MEDSLVVSKEKLFREQKIRYVGHNSTFTRHQRRNLSKKAWCNLCMKVCTLGRARLVAREKDSRTLTRRNAKVDSTLWLSLSAERDARAVCDVK